MNPLLFKECKDASQLIMQVSVPVVLVSELGSDILEILQSLAASGIEGLCSGVNALMPLEDIMGKTIHEVVDAAKFERFRYFPPCLYDKHYISTFEVLKRYYFHVFFFCFMTYRTGHDSSARVKVPWF